MEQRKVFIALAVWAAVVTTISYLTSIDSLTKPNQVVDQGQGEGGVEKHVTSPGTPALPNSVTSTSTIKTPARQSYRQFLKYAKSSDLAQLETTGFDTRGLFCSPTGECFDPNNSVQCNWAVTPYSLSLAEGQALCQPDLSKDYYCTATCNDVGELEWHAHEASWCNANALVPECKDDPTCCPPRPLHLSYAQVLALKSAIPAPAGSQPAPVISDSSPDPTPSPAPNTKDKKPYNKQPRDNAITRPPGAKGTFRQDFLGQKDLSEAELATLKEVGFNARGLICQHQDGKPVCYRQDNQAREKCPPYVTPAYLSLGAGQYSCLPSLSDKYYCTALCQEGSTEVKWNAHEISWCEKHGQCPERNTYTPIEEYAIEPFEELKKGVIAGACTGGDGWEKAGKLHPALKQIAVGILARGGSELESIRDAMKTWAEGGLLEAVGEVLIYLNDRTPEIDKILEKYTHAPYHAKLLGDKENYGITYGINWLAGNSTKPYFLFLEKDFQLIESRQCLNEQLTNGIRLLESNTAQVVRYRSRRHPGFPNWADNAYRGHEDDCLTSRQPNLFCNVFHWVETPEQRWPEHFWDCDRNHKKKPTSAMFYCSDAYFCNWTNNPVMFMPSWWDREYVKGSFTKKLSGNDPYNHLEGYMNWEPNAWNDRKWTVAQGEGLFTHRDRNNFGV